MIELVRRHTILAVVVGSRAYGLAGPDSDHDRRGVYAAGEILVDVSPLRGRLLEIKRGDPARHTGPGKNRSRAVGEAVVSCFCGVGHPA
jgi:hypothetical protein